MPHIAHQKHHSKHKNHFILNKLVLCMAVAEPLMTLPQVYNVWILKQTAGVSIATWSFFTIAAMIWFCYSLTIKNIPLIVSSTLWIVLQGTLVIGLLVN